MGGLLQLFLGGDVFGDDVLAEKGENPVEKYPPDKASALLHEPLCHFELVFVFGDQVLCI